MAKRKSSPSRLATGELPARTVVFDNGSWTIKTDFPTAVPNCIARSDRDKRTYVGRELADDCGDYGALRIRRPMERGYVINWEGEKAVWERTLSELGVHNEEDVTLIWTEAPNATAGLQKNADEMIFEEFGFGASWRTIAPVLNAFAPSAFPEESTECLLVVDVGHAHTTVTPLYHGRSFPTAIRRLDIGGKTLTNQLKELISRTFDVHKEDWIVNEIKEDVCYVTQNFNQDLEKCWAHGPHKRDPSIVVDYVLPDYETIKRGFSRPHDPKLNLRNAALGIGTEGGRREHILTIGNERFVVPELLFCPSDVGMAQEGIPGTIMQSLNSLPAGLKQAFLANILVVGGTSLLPGFMERLEAELRSIVDVDLEIRIARAEDPVRNAWKGGFQLSQNPDVLRKHVVTKQEYEEFGGAWTRKVFEGRVER
ncbi:actin-related protein, ARP6 class [Piedraia hortae CBS 480.64]|uniref:Actin-like protein ARP6 n=1 Tax=Piedraia hortae CBS 480.64 TaxID=1314780 RepID=A0A6A7BQL0_9PEZI|nr:actin-related protein, ARP6 class [Piedraia hortae CBS 480.64]